MTSSKQVVYVPDGVAHRKGARELKVL